MKITYLGPAGATFTSLAYDKLSIYFGTPKVTDPDVEVSYANTNEEVLKIMLNNGGYGAIAMETKARGRVDPPLNSFIELLYAFNKSCQLQVLGALSMRINFALMVKKGIQLADIKTIHAHPKAFEACQINIQKLDVVTIESSSNGKAAEYVSQSDISQKLAVLGPIQEAQKYGLEVLNEVFEDEEAITTFYLIGPERYRMDSGIIRRCLTVFRIPHKPGALVKAITPFDIYGINLRLIHSLYYKNGVYDFAIETEYHPEMTDQHTRAHDTAHKYMERWIQFGPFSVISE
jgi:prephenate dehydratase